MGKKIKFMQGMAAGIAAQYFYDPNAGKVRRARFRDQAAARLRRLGRGLAKKARYQIGRAKGLRHRLITG